MKIKSSFLVFFVICALAVSIVGYLYAQEDGDITDSPEADSGDIAIIPDVEVALTQFTSNRPSVSQNELFTITTRIRNISTLDNFSGGQLGVALVDNNGRIVEVMKVFPALFL